MSAAIGDSLETRVCEVLSCVALFLACEVVSFLFCVCSVLCSLFCVLCVADRVYFLCLAMVGALVL